MIALEILLLFTPAVIFKLYRDRNGVRHPDFLGAAWVTIIMLVSSAMVSTYEYWHAYPGSWTHLRWVNLKTVLVSITGFGLFFNPLINFVLTKHSGWTLKYRIAQSFDRLNPDAVPDKYFIKFKIGWKTRLIGYVALFVGAVMWFVL